MSNTKLHPNPFTQALKDRSEGVLLGPVTIDDLLKKGEELYNIATELVALKPELEEVRTCIQELRLDNVENQK